MMDLFTLKLDVVANDAGESLIEAMSEVIGTVAFGTDHLTWKVSNPDGGAGWPEVEITSSLRALLKVIINYMGPGRSELDELELIKSIQPAVDLTDDYVATEGQELRKGGRDFHL